MSKLYDALLKAEAERAEADDGGRRQSSEPARPAGSSWKALLAATIIGFVTGSAAHSVAVRGRREVVAVPSPVGGASQVNAHPPEVATALEARVPADLPPPSESASALEPPPAAPPSDFERPAAEEPAAVAARGTPVTAPPPVVPAEEPAPKRALPAFSVQIGAFRDRDNATRLVRQLGDRHDGAVVHVARSETPWTVRVGHYADRRDAERARTALAREGLTGFVVSNRP